MDIYIPTCPSTFLGILLRPLLTGGLNGAEPRRPLFVQNEGGAGEVEVADLGALQAVPARHTVADLPQYLGLWAGIVGTQGHGTAPRHLTRMLTNMLPTEVRGDLKKMNVERATSGVRPVPGTCYLALHGPTGRTASHSTTRRATSWLQETGGRSRWQL